MTGRKLTKRHLKLTHEIVRAMKVRDFTGSEVSILYAIIEGTFGTWDTKAGEARDQAEFSLKQLVGETGLAMSTVRQALTSLLADGILIMVRSASSHKPAIFSLQDHTQEWRRAPRFSAGKSAPKTGRKSAPIHAEAPAPKSHRKSAPIGIDMSAPKHIENRHQTREESGMVTPTARAVELEDLPKGSSRTDDDGSVLEYDLALKKVSPIPVTRSRPEVLALLAFVALADYPKAEKLAALEQAVEATLAYKGRKSNVRGPVVCWTIERAVEILAQPKPEPVRYAQDDDEPDWWDEKVRNQHALPAGGAGPGPEGVDLTRIGRDLNDLEDPHGT